MIDCRILVIGLQILGVFLALEVGGYVGSLDEAGIAVFAVGTLSLLWIFLSRCNWWTPILVGATIGGTIYFKFKFYPHEVAIALAIAALPMAILFPNAKVYQTQRKPLPWIFYLAFFYVVGRMSVDVVGAHFHGGGVGNMARLLFSASWPFFFGWLFYYFGNSSAIPLAMGLTLLGLVVRIVGALAGTLTSEPIYIPGINYVLSLSSDTSLYQLRSIAFNAMFVLLIFFHSSRSLAWRGLLCLLICVSAYLVMLGGSRFMAALMLLSPLAFFIWSRRWVLIVSALTVVIGFISIINIVPDSVRQLPDLAQRSLSILIVTNKSIAAEQNTEGSDTWHQNLKNEGYRRWTLTPLYFLAGYGVRPSPEFYNRLDTDVNLDKERVIAISANEGSYESGLWTELAVLGIVGFTLYLLLFIALWRRVIPYLRRKPRGTLNEAMVFWGFLISIMWYLGCNFSGAYPGLELFLMILGWCIVQDEAASGPVPAQAPAQVPSSMVLSGRMAPAR